MSLKAWEKRSWLGQAEQRTTGANLLPGKQVWKQGGKMGHSQIMRKRGERRSKAKEERRKGGSLEELGLSTSIGRITDSQQSHDVTAVTPV